MPNYVKKALKQFQHIAGTLQQSPYPTSVPIRYGAKKQYATAESTAPLVDAKSKRFIQQVCGKFLFLGQAVDSTLLCPISAIVLQSSQPTEDTMRHTQQLLITWPPRRRPSSHTMQTTWYWQYTVTQTTSANPRHKVGQGDISSYPVTCLYHQTTERCWTLPT